MVSDHIGRSFSTDLRIYMNGVSKCYFSRIVCTLTGIQTIFWKLNLDRIIAHVCY